MPQQTSPFIEGKWGWDFGESGWNTGADDNWLKFSYLFDNNVDGVVSSLPTAVNGEAYFLTTDNRFYFAVGTTWRSSPCPKWFIFKVRSTGMFWQFDGSVAVEINNPQQANAALEAIQDVIDTLGTAAFVSLESLATQAELDVAIANAAEYADTTMATHVATSDPHTQYTLETDLANTSDIAKGAALVGFKQSGTGAVARTAYTKLKEWVSIKDFGAIGDGVTDDTDAIQAAIDAVFSAGGGIVYVPSGTYVVSQTVQTLPVLLVSAGGVLNPTNTSTQSCLILRSGVTLVGQSRKQSILSAAIGLARTVISLYDMSSGGILSLTCKGGKGLQTHVSDFDADMCNLVLDDIEIYDSSSYGLGMQYGLYKNNHYSRLYIHDTAQDAFDHKCKPRESTGEIAYGLTITDVLCERYGLTSATESAGVDVRGLVQLNNIVCRDFNRTGTGNIGIRFSTGIWLGEDHRIGSHKSTLSNFYIDSGDASGDSVGISLLEASEVIISNGVIENCGSLGFGTADTVTGNGTAQNNSIIGVNVVGSRGTSFQTAFPGTSFIACKALQAEDRFAENSGNLVVGQTVLTVERTFDPAKLSVYKNGSLLTLTTDYTVTGTDTITLVAAAISGDVFLVVTSGTTGFLLQDGSEGRVASNSTIVGCSSKGITTPISVSSSSLSTLTTSGNNFDGATSTLRTSFSGPYIEALGTSTNIDIELRPKGTGVVALRSNGTRALVATNSTSSNVNWVEARGAATGVNVRLSAQGSDTNINLDLTPKGTGAIVVPARDYADDAAAAAGGIPINGIYRTGNDLKIRLV